MNYIHQIIFICTNITPAKTAIMLLDVPVFLDLEHSKHLSVLHVHAQHFWQAGLAMPAQTFCALAAVYQVMEAGCHTRTWGLRALNPSIVTSSECGHKTVMCFEECTCASCLWVPPEKSLQEQKYRLVALWGNPNECHHFFNTDNTKEITTNGITYRLLDWWLFSLVN